MEVWNVDEQVGQNKMLPPPMGTFQTREELLKHVRDFALAQGYMVSIKDSSKDRYVTIACDRGGVYRKRVKTGENMRQRKASSRLTNCPFEVVGKKDDDLWVLSIKHGEHNHEPSKSKYDHPSCRRFSEEEILIIREMTVAGKRPWQILKVLRQKNPNLVSDSRNVYNVKAKIRREMLSGKRIAPPPTSLGIVNNGIMGAGIPSEQMAANGATMQESIDNPYLENDAVKETKVLASELCRHFYTLGWLLGSGGSIAIKIHDDSIPKSRQLIVMSPSGVQKERMVPEDMYVLSSDGFILSTPPLRPYPYKPLKCTDCAPLFLKISDMEMIKGIQGHGYHDELVVPIIENTAHEGELIEALTAAVRDYPMTTAVLVRNHGVFIWGESWISAKTQAECYHYLFDAATKIRQLGLDKSTPGDHSIRIPDESCGCGSASSGLKAGTLGIDYVIKPSQQCILLSIEGTTTPASFISGVLFPYANDNLVKYLVSTYDSRETQHDINLLRAQVCYCLFMLHHILTGFLLLLGTGFTFVLVHNSSKGGEHCEIQNDLEQGILGAAPVAPEYMGKKMVIDTLVVNVEAMIQANREVTALKLLQDHIWMTGFQSNELGGIVFEDVPEALKRWHALGIKVYIYSNDGREIQRLLFANSNYGDMRKYLCGFFDTAIGSKQERQSYVEILQTVGVDRPADVLFVTNVMQEAEAASAAGLEVKISIRPGNGPLAENHGFTTIESLLEIQSQVV
ncbi:probable bifunctional methylthioribulose-1-phosphate dehydratase/enolase-phosphatase E1 2 isoform X2 [Diospyros lotus]|uniref:probable bifunctional methylthioribulose-1-phosphate dehydratase/enolase-phosphatase E1 2 isoform X2 n=1 Tax=Diospyros lotus TaxID=55363 RepID=UPI00225780A0|nr:probable bifunctional methylthioribulose-1-phosphate dehydratase/enolase-phosphatase E1 2 isoform X2 [Diospyros lotus]